MWHLLLWRFREPDPEDLDDRFFAMPVRDDQLTLRMLNGAEQFSRRDARLDFSPSSLVDVEDAARNTGLNPKERWRLGCYFGEVIRRNAPEADWAWPSVRHQRKGLQPVVVFDRWSVDPFEIVERHPSVAKSHSDATLSSMAEDVLTYARDPSSETARPLGWKTKRPDNWTVMRGKWRARQRRRMEQGARE